MGEFGIEFSRDAFKSYKKLDSQIKKLKEDKVYLVFKIGPRGDVYKDI